MCTEAGRMKMVNTTGHRTPQDRGGSGRRSRELERKHTREWNSEPCLHNKPRHTPRVGRGTPGMPDDFQRLQERHQLSTTRVKGYAFNDSSQKMFSNCQLSATQIKRSVFNHSSQMISFQRSQQTSANNDIDENGKNLMNLVLIGRKYVTALAYLPAFYQPKMPLIPYLKTLYRCPLSKSVDFSMENIRG